MARVVADPMATRTMYLVEATGDSGTMTGPSRVTDRLGMAEAVTDSLLVDTRRHFRAVEVLDGGGMVRVQPRVILRQVSSRLAPTAAGWVRTRRVSLPAKP